MDDVTALDDAIERKPRYLLDDLLLSVGQVRKRHIPAPCPGNHEFLPDVRRHSIEDQVQFSKPDVRAEFNDVSCQSCFFEHFPFCSIPDGLTGLDLSANESPKTATVLSPNRSNRGIIDTHQEQFIGLVQEYDFDGIPYWIGHRLSPRSESVARQCRAT